MTNHLHYTQESVGGAAFAELHNVKWPVLKYPHGTLDEKFLNTLNGLPPRNNCVQFSYKYTKDMWDEEHQRSEIKGADIINCIDKFVNILKLTTVTHLQ